MDDLEKEEKHNVGIMQLFNGDLVQLIDAQLIELYADMRDPNKLAGSKRELNITIKAAAPEKRKSAKLSYEVKTKLGAREGGECQIYLSGQGEEVESALAPINQQTLFDDSKSSN